MSTQPEFTKYILLDEWFGEQPASVKQLTLTFDQVEEILGEKLPESASKLATWWTNLQPRIQNHRTAWLNHGWQVVEFDQRAQWVRFIRSSSVQ